MGDASSLKRKDGVFFRTGGNKVKINYFKEFG